MTFRHRREAWAELSNRYTRTFAHFWKHRDQLQSGLFRENEAAFLPAALSIQETPPSNTARWIARILVLMILTAFAWAVFGRMDIIVNAQGKVIPSAYTKTIAAVETGSVVTLNVEEGQRVKAGQILLQLDTSALDAERDKALNDRSEAVLTLARNQALLSAIAQQRPPQLPALNALNSQYQSRVDPDKWQAAEQQLQGQYRDYAAKSKKFADDITHYSQALPLATQQAESYKALTSTNDVSHDAWLEKEQARLQLEGQLQEARNQQASLRTETTKDALDQIADARKIAQDSSEDALQASSTSKLLTLKSPVDGTVQQLSIHALGGVVQAAQPIMQVVPSGGLVEVEATLENKDKGFVHAGQAAKVKVDTFEYTKYGTLPGKVIHVSEDAIPDEKHDKLNYSVRVLLERSTLDIDGKNTPIIPGMSVSVEIKTGDRRIIEYVLSPVLRYTHEATNER